MTTPRIRERRVAYASPYLDVVEKEVELGGMRGIETFWSVRTAGYTAILAVTEDGRIPLVRQYRPAVRRHALELPSGAIEKARARGGCRRELLEETGCEGRDLAPLGRLHVDSGRFETQQWAFFASNAASSRTSRAETRSWTCSSFSRTSSERPS